MSTLFVANISKHKHIFHFDIPEGGKGKLPIEPMTQQIIARNLSPEAVEAVLSHHRRYGLVEWRDARRSKTFVGLCYSLDEPVKIEVFFETQETNDAAINATAAQVEEQSSVALMDKIEKQLGKPVSRIEVETVESINSGDTKRPDIAKGVEVVKPGVQPKHVGGTTIVKK